MAPSGSGGTAAGPPDCLHATAGRSSPAMTLNLTAVRAPGGRWAEVPPMPAAGPAPLTPEG